MARRAEETYVALHLAAPVPRRVDGIRRTPVVLDPPMPPSYDQERLKPLVTWSKRPFNLVRNPRREEGFQPMAGRVLPWTLSSRFAPIPLSTTSFRLEQVSGSFGSDWDGHRWTSSNHAGNHLSLFLVATRLRVRITCACSNCYVDVEVSCGSTGVAGRSRNGSMEGAAPTPSAAQPKEEKPETTEHINLKVKSQVRHA